MKLAQLTKDGKIQTQFEYFIEESCIRGDLFMFNYTVADKSIEFERDLIASVYLNEDGGIHMSTKSYLYLNSLEASLSYRQSIQLLTDIAAAEEILNMSVVNSPAYSKSKQQDLMNDCTVTIREMTNLEMLTRLLEVIHFNDLNPLPLQEQIGKFTLQMPVNEYEEQALGLIDAINSVVTDTEMENTAIKSELRALKEQAEELLEKYKENNK